MQKRILRHILQKPVSSLAVFLFAAVLSVVLCALNQNQVLEQEDHQRSYASVPVYFTVVDLDGTLPDKTIAGWAAELFYPDSKLKPNFSHLAQDVEFKMKHSCRLPDGGRIDVTGASSIRLLPELEAKHGGGITWLDGYDENIFSSGEAVCLVPMGLSEESQLTLEFEYTAPHERNKRTCTENFTVVGYVTSRDGEQIYFPYQTLGKILSRLQAPYAQTCISATLSDNTQLEELREIARRWFAQPNASGKKTPWGQYDYEYFPYALDIDDGQLQKLNTTLERSIQVNRFSALAVFCIAAVMGFLAGFLVIRARKRDIFLMRTLGCPNLVIFRELTGEQVICSSAGVILGGSYTLWQPTKQLILFLAIYYAGLCTAMLIFLGKNLIITIKEEN